MTYIRMAANCINNLIVEMPSISEQIANGESVLQALENLRNEGDLRALAKLLSRLF
jgi:hypothetical protein